MKKIEIMKKKVEILRISVNFLADQSRILKIETSGLGAISMMEKFNEFEKFVTFWEKIHEIYLKQEKWLRGFFFQFCFTVFSYNFCKILKNHFIFIFFRSQDQ